MKLLLENWRKYLAEESQPIKKLRIFDFDETIAYTDSQVRVTLPNGKSKSFPSQKSWDDFIAKHSERSRGPRKSMEELEADGYVFDFTDYSKVIDPEENKMITKIISDVINANKENPEREIYIITPRGPEAEESIRKYLRTVGLEPEAFEGIIGLNGASKRDEINNIISRHTDESGMTSIESIHFFDDSDKNLEDVKRIRDEHPEIEDIRIKKVVRGDILSLEETIY